MQELKPTSSPVMPLRAPEQVMRLERMGAGFPTRLSFMRSLIRRMHRESWVITQSRFELDKHGYGHAVYRVSTPNRIYSLVAYSNVLDDDQRTDRVIAEAWDTAFVLFDGEPKDDDIERLAENTPRQEAGRYLATELVLSRANKSVRLYKYICECLASGVQPDVRRLADVGYLMRTTAVYGNGKFGVSDREKICARPELAGPFQAEMLTVYLIRCFTHDHIEHVARCRSPDTFVPLNKDLKRFLGIGNATGLGMAPFLVSHPILLNNWMVAKETALARVRSVRRVNDQQQKRFRTLLARAQQHVSEWRVDDALQTQRIVTLRSELEIIQEWTSNQQLTVDSPWDELFQRVESSLSVETQECLISLTIEVHPELADELEGTMSTDESLRLDPTETTRDLRRRIERDYDWALSIDFSVPDGDHYFWYTSEEKLEPRLGRRYQEPGAEWEMPLAIARDVQDLYRKLVALENNEPVARLLLGYPQYRYVVRRVQNAATYPYGEIRDNLVGAGYRPIDMLRWKLAFFGASKFDPKSDRWTRITLYQGAPLADELGNPNADDWCFPITPKNP